MDTPAQAPPQLPPRLPIWVRLALTMVGMFLPLLSLSSVGPVLALLVPDTQGLPNWVKFTTQAVVMVIPAFVGMLVAWLLVRFVDRRPLSTIGLVFTKRSIPLWLIGLVLATVVVAVFGIILTQVGLLREGIAVKKSLTGAILTILFGFAAQGFPEELLWRGYALQTLRERPLLSVVVSGVLFGMMHIFSQGGQQNLAERFIYLTAAGAFGIFAGVLAVAFRSLWPAVGVHCGVHLGYYISGLFNSGSGPAWWICEAIGFLALAAAFYVRYHNRFSIPITLTN